jgi:hypothetical protein
MAGKLVIGRLLWLVIPLLTVSCASMEYRRVEGVEQDAKADGFRYYDASPYLIVHSNADGTLAIRLEYLPGPNKKMSVRPKATAAKLETTLEFERGTLKSSKSLADATVVPKAILDAAAKILPFVLEDPEKIAALEEYKVPQPYLFKILVKGDDTFLVGGRGEGPAITISLTAKK